jgi:subtilisin
MKVRHDLWSMSFAGLGAMAALLLLYFPAAVSRVAAQNVPDESAADLEREQAFEDTTAEDLLREARQQGSVNIIVMLATTFRPEGELSAAQDVLRQRLAIARDQDQLLAALSGHRISGIKRFKYLAYVATAVDEGGLIQLIHNPALIRIMKDEMVQPTLAQSFPLINADDVWAAGLTGSTWAVAVLDTGVDKTHLFLDQGKVVSEACYSTNDTHRSMSSLCPNGQTSQGGSGTGVNCPANIVGCDHGTHVAGIAAGNATGTTRDDLSGVAKAGNIIAIQIFSRVDSPSACAPAASPCTIGSYSDIMRGLERVFELRSTFKIAAVNMSLGGGRFTSNCDTDPLKAPIDNLRSVGIASVVASGNSGFADTLAAPACISSAISVGNTTKSDTVRDSSNSASFLSLLAPGTNIESAVPGNGNVASKTGTSMAAPHVAEAFAILRQAKPSASVSEILSTLQSTGVLITDSRNHVIKPRINVKAAFDALTGTTSAPTITSPTPGSALPGASVTFRWTANGAPVLEWWLTIGTSLGATNIYNSGSLGTSLSRTVNGLPTNGGQLFVRLYFRPSQGWQSTDVQYTAARAGVGRSLNGS